SFQLLEAGPEDRQRDLPRQRDRRQGHNERRQVDPADEPSECRGTGSPGPGVYPAAERVAASEVGEAEGQAELPDEHGGPGPEEGRAGLAIAEVEVLDDAGEDGKVGEAGREGGEAAEPATELREITGPSQVVVVIGRDGLGHGTSGSGKAAAGAFPLFIDFGRAR